MHELPQLVNNTLRWIAFIIASIILIMLSNLFIWFLAIGADKIIATRMNFWFLVFFFPVIIGYLIALPALLGGAMTGLTTLILNKKKTGSIVLIILSVTNYLPLCIDYILNYDGVARIVGVICAIATGYSAISTTYSIAREDY